MLIGQQEEKLTCDINESKTDNDRELKTPTERTDVRYSLRRIHSRPRGIQLCLITCRCIGVRLIQTECS